MRSTPKLKILTFSTLYPNAVMPNHGVFVEQRLRHLLVSGEVESRVIAPVPWFPVAGQLFGSYGNFARVPVAENRHDIEVYHPRYLRIPKVAMSAVPAFMAHGAAQTLAIPSSST